MTSEAKAAAWNWDQGRLAYFQFDALQKIARFVCVHDFMRADRQSLSSATGLKFQATFDTRALAQLFPSAKAVFAGQQG